MCAFYLLPFQTRDMSTWSLRKTSNSSSSKTLDLLLRTLGSSSFTGLKVQKKNGFQICMFMFPTNKIRTLKNSIISKCMKNWAITSAGLDPVCPGWELAGPPGCCWWPAQSCSCTPAGRRAGSLPPNQAAGPWYTTAETPAPLRSQDTQPPEVWGSRLVFKKMT